MGGREVRGLKWPDFADTAATNDIIKCKDLCMKNCTCNAYTFASGIRCMIWSGNFVDVEHFDEGGNSLYVRLTKSELGSRKKISYVLWIVIATAITVVVGIIILILWRFNGKLLGITKVDKKNDKVIHDMSSTVRGFSAVFSEVDDIAIDGKHGSVPQLPLFSFNDIEIATNDFANKNKLGEGGFRSVYKNTQRNVTPCPTLFVASLGPTASEQELVQVFSRYEGIDTASSSGALAHLQGTILYSSRPGEGMRLEYAKSRMGMRSKHSR
ncbi:hypothetical protein POM88_039705 [Heracleum sosnowskyi]|uniref:Apple domain-containing protein n=1 Tax=Heracleum sosnowskyi TaxID=360622 RepID=A0AAD8M938_9APIA|nr:hypothetical protein POM88_039705 [Heracleum sosnowskyi]